MSFLALSDGYGLEGRTLFELMASANTVTLRFDLYHCDDERRCEDGMEYLLDITVPPERFRIVDGAGERLRGDFSADILQVEIRGGEMRLLADCSFYDPPKGRDVVLLALAGGEADVTEHPPAKVA
ncbi:hypothetical protein [Aureimonas sp. ME7]|uniref:hypothetical protein n=1 Tax=Aureimonas sp. ME7 TaxID=2744252 RepID=UPI0015F69DF8|nr:hypothetical protein [Aureimonas sp. ME7]